MKLDKKYVGLIVSIVFASVIISGSLIFLGTKLAGNNNASVSEQDIQKAIENYATKMQQQKVEEEKKEQEDKNKLAQNLKPVTKEDHVLGNRNAKISLVEYSDFECPYCKSFHAETLKLLAAYPNDVNLVYRHFPLGFHEPMATKEAIASECVADQGGNDKFWKFVDLVFERTNSGGHGLDDDKILQIVSDIGLNQSQFKTCIGDGRFAQKIKDQIKDGESAGVEGTPGDFFINNKTGDVTLLGGALSFDDLKMVLDSLLN